MTGHIGTTHIQICLALAPDFFSSPPPKIPRGHPWPPPPLLKIPGGGGVFQEKGGRGQGCLRGIWGWGGGRGSCYREKEPPLFDENAFESPRGRTGNRTVTQMRHPRLVEGRPDCARQSLASTLLAPRVAATSYCDPSRHANVITPGLLTPCLNVPKNYRVRGQRKHINVFNINFLASTQNTPFWASRKKFRRPRMSGRRMSGTSRHFPRHFLNCEFP